MSEQFVWYSPKGQLFDGVAPNHNYPIGDWHELPRHHRHAIIINPRTAVTRWDGEPDGLRNGRQGTAATMEKSKKSFTGKVGRPPSGCSVQRSLSCLDRDSMCKCRSGGCDDRLDVHPTDNQTSRARSASSDWRARGLFNHDDAAFRSSTLRRTTYRDPITAKRTRACSFVSF